MTAPEAPSRASVLLVDDDAPFRERLARALHGEFEVHQADSLPCAVDIAGAESPEFAVVDLKLGFDSGLQVVAQLHHIDPQTRIIVLTGYGSIATALEAVRLGAVHYLQKPASSQQIIAALREGLVSRPSLNDEVPSLADIEREHIERVLFDCGGNISHAAARLGLHRRSLQRKLRR